MLRIIALLLSAWLDVILCETQLSEHAASASRMSSCRNPPLCDLSDTYKIEQRNDASSQLQFYSDSQTFAASQQPNYLRRSYYSGFGSFASPAHYQ